MVDDTRLDGAAPVRQGEELDLPALGAYLSNHLPVEHDTLPLDQEQPLLVAQFPRGYSNLTYLLQFGNQELVLRRPPFGANIKGGHDMGREYRILSGLQGIYPKAPRPLLYCDDQSVIGAPFYVMQRVHGVILRHPLPQGLAIEPAQMRRISTALVETLAELHAVDFRTAGLAALGKTQGYVARQVHGWTQRYDQARTQDVPDMERAAAWLAETLKNAILPKEEGDESRAALIHNDFKLDNLILDPHNLTQVAAVLDWEMATIGDPLMDLGTTLAYWIQEEDPEELRRIGLVGFKGSLRRSEVVAHYAQCRGASTEQLQSQMPFYYVFGLFKVAVIAQQIYFRFVQGHTRDGRFSGLDAVVAACAGMAVRALETGQIE